MIAGWAHKPADESHPADAHYAADGKWVCFTCRERVEYVGDRVAVEVAAEPPRDGPPGGLEADGS